VPGVVLPSNTRSMDVIRVEAYHTGWAMHFESVHKKTKKKDSVPS